MSGPTVEEKLQQVATTEGRASRTFEQLIPKDGKPGIYHPANATARSQEIHVKGITWSRWERRSDGRFELVERDCSDPRPLSEVELPGDGPAAVRWNALKRGRK